MPQVRIAHAFDHRLQALALGIGLDIVITFRRHHIILGQDSERRY
jgi:hypothetical protein